MIKLTAKNIVKYTGDVLVYFIFESEKQTLCCQNSEISKAAKQANKNGDFSGKEGEVFYFYPLQSGKGKGAGFAAKRVMLVGMGKLSEELHQQSEQLRIAGGQCVIKSRSLKCNDMLVVLPETFDLSAGKVAENLSEGLLLANYNFSKYKNKDEEEGQGIVIKRIFLHRSGMSEAKICQGMQRGCRAATAALAARDMAHEPGNKWTSVNFADYSQMLSEKSGLHCRIIEKQEMNKLGMGGILGVNQGSKVPPKMVVLEYISKKKNPTLMIVGKGLTFDSGGISLKPAAGMEDMKYDMCGGAAVLGAMQVIAEENPEHINVVALIPATDNMSGSAAIRPGDIITHCNGKTTEVINTDAEGRLILADALAYGVKTFEPDAIVDLATLTGAVIFGLGHHRTGLLSNDDHLAESVAKAGQTVGEPVWRLPLDKEYTKQLKSDIADLKNVGGRAAGTITAAAFLQEFVNEIPWVHLDIAGTAWNFTEKSYIPKGPSGTGVRTLVQLVRNWGK